MASIRKGGDDTFDKIRKRLPEGPAKLASVAEENGLDKDYRRWIRKGNAGVARMALGNALVGKLRRGEPVKVGGRGIRA